MKSKSCADGPFWLASENRPEVITPDVSARVAVGSSPMRPKAAFAAGARLACIILASVITWTLPALAETAVIAWDPNSATEQVSTYNIYFDQGAGFYKLGTVQATSTPTFRIAGVTPGLTYKVYVTAVNAVGESPASDTLVITVPVSPPAEKPTKPTNVRATIEKP